jgi:HSP20 family protein
MSLTKWNPAREIEDLFDRYSRAIGWPGNGNQELIKTGDWAPQVDISETDKEFVIKAEIPEVEKKDVKVTVEHGVLRVQGERKQEKEEKGKKFHRIERSYGSFSRSFTLPDNVDGDNIKATFKDGVLNLQIPKVAEAKTKATEVKVH